MKRIITNTIAAIALVAGLIIGATCHGLLAFLLGVALGYGGLITLIGKNTDWLENY